MADLRISQLPVLGEAALQSDDVVATVDISASETKKITVKDLVQKSVTLIDAGSIPGDKVNVTLADGSVGTLQLADGSVTAVKLADNSSAIVASPLPATGAFIGQVGVDNAELFIWDGSTWVELAGGIISVAGGTAGPVTTTATTSGNRSTVVASINDSTVKAEFLAGPTASAGAVGLRTIVPDDLPVAGGTTAGIVTVPQGGGLTIDGGTSGAGSDLIIDNAITSSSDHHMVTYNDKGLITAGRGIVSSDLPVATTSSVGGVAVTSGEFTVDPDGFIKLANQITGSTHSVVTYNNQGLITSGRDLTEDDIPDIPASKITSGELPTDRLADDAVTARKIGDYSTCLIQEDSPGGSADYFLGMLWFQPSSASLYVYARGSGNQNMWMRIGFANFQGQQLRWGGTYDASTGNVGVVTAIGATAGLEAGSPVPAASDLLGGLYLLCTDAGSALTVPNLDGVDHTVGDWIACVGETQGWIHLDVTNDAGGGGGGGGASRLNDLLDVEVGSGSSVSLADQQLLKYDSGSGVWRNQAVVDGGTF